MAVSGQPPYGFEWNGGQLAVDRSEAAIRLRMFELFVLQKRLGVVARLLNDDGLRTRRGANWSDNAVKRLLVCESAIGLYPINKTTKDANGKRVTKPESEWDYVQCSEIIPQSLWEDVQRLLGSKSPPAARTTVHLFSGLAFCECGGKMRVPTSARRYVCSDCKHKIPINNLLSLFRDKLQTFLENRAKSLSPGGDSPAITSEEAKIAELESRVAKAEELYLAGKINAERFGEINEPLQREIDSLNRNLAKRANRDESESDLERKFNLLPSSLLERWDVLNTDKKRLIVETILDKLIVGADDVQFHMRLFKSPKELVTSRRTDSPTNALESSVEEESGYIRLPKAGERCPLSGYTRSSLNNLILPCAYNNFTPLVESISKRLPGKKRGIRLIVWSSLKAYLGRQTE